MDVRAPRPCPLSGAGPRSGPLHRNATPPRCWRNGCGASQRRQVCHPPARSASVRPREAGIGAGAVAPLGRDPLAPAVDPERVTSTTATLGWWVCGPRGRRHGAGGCLGGGTSASGAHPLHPHAVCAMAMATQSWLKRLTQPQQFGTTLSRLVPRVEKQRARKHASRSRA